LRLSFKLDQAHEVGVALVAIAEAQLTMENANAAQEAASEAAGVFERTGEQEFVEMAIGIANAAKDILERPKKMEKPQAAAGADPNRPPWLKGMTNRPGGRPGFNPRGPKGAGKGGDAAANEAPQPRAGPQRKAWERDNDAANLPSNKRSFGWTDAQKSNAPDQDERRRQLLEANQAQARRQTPAAEDAAPKKSPSKLRHVLSQVRPDWSAKELSAVMDKFKKVDIDSKAELFSQLRTIGIGGLNNKLRESGQTTLKADTWKALLAKAEEEATKSQNID
jgi:hypothetical protein